MMHATKPKQGFTLMELMIALGLLGALMAVAWSLLGTFRDAEMRGWKLSYRTQTIRSAREWLENDLQHLVLVAAPMQPVSSTRAMATTFAPRGLTSTARPAAFYGTAMGFTATISPSVDPIPFLGNLMSEPAETNLAAPSEEMKLGEGFGEVARPASLWPADYVEIEYELVPMPGNLSSKPSLSSSISDGLLDETQYSLVRREQVDVGSRTVSEAPSERVLSAQDLYRQADESVLANASPMSESRLDGLMHPQFRYFDGVAWVAQWNSGQRGGLPRAIAFGFDFPPASEILHPSDRPPEEPNEGGRIEDNYLTTADPLLNPLEQESETIQERASGGNQGIMIASTNEVQLVIFVAAGIVSKSVASEQPIAGGRP